jgi:hypothetical protein
LSKSEEGFTLDIQIQGRLPTIGVEEDISFATLLRNIRYLSLFPVVFKKAFRGVTEHNFPLSESAILNIEAGLHMLMLEHRIPANKLLLAVPLFTYVHILNDSDYHLLGHASTLLAERADLEGSGLLAYDQVERTSDQINNCTEFNVLNLQVCEYVLESNSTWTIYKDDDASSVFATNTTEWISFESPQTLMRKVDE